MFATTISYPTREPLDMKSSRSEIHRKTHAIPELRFEDQKLTSFSGLVIFQRLFDRLDLKTRLRQCFRQVAVNPIFGHANIVLLLIFMAGGLSLTTMVRESFPQFSVDFITITVPYPGADPEEVEEGICRKIEEAIEGVEGIKQYTTESRENQGAANIEVSSGFGAPDPTDPECS